MVSELPMDKFWDKKKEPVLVALVLANAIGLRNRQKNVENGSGID